MPVPVVLVTYSRSGSCFVGNILKLDDSVFYVFEPLHFLKFGHRVLHFSDGSMRTLNTYLTVAEHILRAWFTCQLNEIPLEYWDEEIFQSTKIQGKHIFYFKERYKREIYGKYRYPSRFRATLQLLEDMCIKSKLVIIKTIRTPIFMLNKALSELDNLKMIYLYRDPRGIIRSQRRNLYISKENTFESLNDHAENLCARIFNDAITFAIFLHYYPEKLLPLKYETFTMNLMRETKHLYNYLNLTLTARHVDTLIKMTTTKERAKNYIPKNNSKELVDRWRTLVDMSFVDTVDMSCSHVYSRLGYLQISDVTMLKNISIPLYLNNGTNKQFHFGQEIPV
ncbi:carbohydrate sulfotransferase 1-like [Mytilus californianus]|uniref:carbohydrate sulfotransferase 1-like n=1 Tax=Mytilus californianus TaxID=6549 RepID=UPI002246C458|nr:carbohydrate sulfotransferase 1-like [Mytilus californianus]